MIFWDIFVDINQNVYWTKEEHFYKCQHSFGSGLFG